MLRFSRSLWHLRVPALLLGALLLAPGVRAQSASSCTYYVNGTSGNDGATGTSAGTAWRTIGRANDTAATSVPTGSVVCIAPGTYYEAIQPRRDGVTYRGLTTGGQFNVVVSGLDPVPLTGWVEVSTNGQTPQTGTGLWKWTWAPRAGWATDPDGGTNWFASYRIIDSGPESAQRRELLVANTGRPGVGTAADGRLEGHVMLPVASLPDLNSVRLLNYASPEYGVYGAFWVETAPPSGPSGIMGRPIAIYARFYGPSGSVTPAVAQPRIAARTATFIPRLLTGAPGDVEHCGEANNSGGFTVENIAFRHSNALIQRGSVCPGRSGSTFRNVAVEFTNGAGINTGRHSGSTDAVNTSGNDETGRNHRFIGVRSNYNGQLGMGGECDDCQIIDSELSFNNWKDHDYGWEAGGSKFSFTSRTLLRRVRSFRNNGPGIWFDIANQDNVIEGSWADGNSLAGIFLELYTVRTLVQHNIVSGTHRTRSNNPRCPSGPNCPVGNYDGTGFGIQDAPENYLFHNTSVNNDGAGFYFNTTSRINGTRPGARFGYPETTWAGSRGRMVNNVAAGNTLVATLPGGETDASFSREAREIQIEDSTVAGARANTFLGNLYLGHDTPAEAALGQQGFGLFGRTGPPGGGTGNTNARWKELLNVPTNAPGYTELVLDFGERDFSGLAAPSAWPNWPATLRMGSSVRETSFPQIPAGSVPNRRQGYCYGWNGANPEAVLGSFYLDRPAPSPSDCSQPQSQNVAYITTNTTLTASNSAFYAGKETYVSDNVTLTISGTFTLQPAGGIPARLHLNGRLIGSGNIAVTGGGEFIIRPLANTSGFTGSIPLTGAGSCLMVREGARFDLAPGQSIDASDGALVAILTGGTLALGEGARMTFRATAAAAQIRPGARVEMGRNARVEFFNPVQLVGTAAQPVVFERSGGAAWGGVTVAGAGSRVAFVAFDGGMDNLTVTGSNTVVEDVTSVGAAGAALVVRTPAAVDIGAEIQAETSGVVVRRSRLAGSAIGAQFHLTHGASLVETTVEDNVYGVSLFNAGVSTFRCTHVTGSGKYGVYLSGASTLVVGPETAGTSAASGCTAGLNRITGSGSAEIMAGSGSWFDIDRTGIADVFGGYNAVWDASGVLVWTGEKRMSFAEATWWGGPLDLDRIVGSVSTAVELDADPTAGGAAAPCATDAETLASARTRLAVQPADGTHEEAVRDLLGPALSADATTAAEARALIAAWARPATDAAVASSPFVAAAATAAGLVQARVALAGDDPDAAEASLGAMPAPDRDGVRVEMYRMKAAVAEADARYADALAALDAADAIVLPEPPMDAGKRSLSTREDVDPLRRALAASAEAAHVRTADVPAQAHAAAPAALRVPAPWPNPSRGSVTVAVEVPAAGALRVAVFDALGRSVAVMHDGQALPGRLESRLDVSALAAGVYTVRAVMAGGVSRSARFSVVR